jgi:hypothetical protein
METGHKYGSNRSVREPETGMSAEAKPTLAFAF